jgi:CBS domain-containing protein
MGSAPVFPMPNLAQPSGEALAMYILLGVVIGVAGVYVTRAVYLVEDTFDRLPIHWMWWPAIGAVVVGVIGYFAPHTMGVGYDNITDLLAGNLTGAAIAVFDACKYDSWSIYLGSGTSGGTLAPLFTFGGGLGALLSGAAAAVFPTLAIDPKIGALVGMAAMFAGASRALLTSVVFAFETTRQPLGLLPLLGGCTASYLISALLMKHSIMTERIVRRGTQVPFEYEADFLGQVAVSEAASRTVVSLRAGQTIEEVRAFIASGAAGSGHQGFPVLDDGGKLVGVVTRRDLAVADPASRIGELGLRAPVVVFLDSSLRDAADQMVRQSVGRLAVVTRDDPSKVVAMLSRSDLIGAHARRLEQQHALATPRRLGFGPRRPPA